MLGSLAEGPGSDVRQARAEEALHAEWPRGVGSCTARGHPERPGGPGGQGACVPEVGQEEWAGL